LIFLGAYNCIAISSAASKLNFWVQPLQLDASLPNSKLPVDGSLLSVGPTGPGGYFRSQGLDAAVGQALSGQATQFALGHVEPTTVFGGVDEIDSSHILTSLVRRERFVNRPLHMCVEVVTDQCDSRRIGIPSVE